MKILTENILQTQEVLSIKYQVRNFMVIQVVRRAEIILRWQPAFAVESIASTAMGMQNVLGVAILDFMGWQKADSILIEPWDKQWKMFYARF